MAYFGQVKMPDRLEPYLIGSSLYGTTNTYASSPNKFVSTGILGRDFDELVLGVTVNVQFIQGNTVEDITLKVGSTAALPVHGNAKCNQNALLSFTYGNVDGVGHWILNAGEKTATTVMQHYDSSSTEPISGAGVAEAIAPLTGGTSAATLGVDTTIGANPTNDKVPTSAAVAGYVTDAFGKVDAVVYKGTMGLSGTETNIPTNGYSAGWLYKIISAGTYAGEQCEVGDLILATQDAGQFQTAVNNAHWTVIQKNIANVVSGPVHANTGNVAIFDGNSTTLADSGHTIATDVPANAVFTDTTYTAGTGIEINGNNQISISFGDSAGTAVEGNDVRLTGPRTPTAHTHGNITNDGTLTQGDRAVVTNEEGIITTANLTTTIADPEGETPIYISDISQDAQGKISASKERLPIASTNVAGITTVGANGGAAAYNHDHSGIYSEINHTHNFTGFEGYSIIANTTTGDLTAIDLTTTDPNANGSTNTFIDTINQDAKGKITATKKSLSVATNQQIGGIKIGYTTDSVNRRYAIQLSQDNEAYVEVPATAPAEVDFGVLNAELGVVTNSIGKLTTKDLTYDSNDNSPTNIEFIKRVQMDADGEIHTAKSVLPTVGNGQAGIVPAGTTVNTQTQSTKFLREDGTWETPSYTTNTDSKVEQIGIAETAQVGAGEDLHILLKKSANTTDEIDSVKYIKTQDAHVTINTKTGKVSAPTFEGTNSTPNAIHFLGKANSASNADTAAEVPWSGVQNTPTTIAGYGITDAAASNHTHGAINNNGTMSTALCAIVTDTNKNIALLDMTVTDPSVINNATDTEFISNLEQSSQGKITTLIKKKLPTANTTTAGIVKLGATGGAAAYDHNHDANYAPKTHTHGNIQNNGALQTNDVTIANEDKLVITDASDSNKIARASIAFDGATATKALTQKGTWETFNNYSLPVATDSILGGIKIGFTTHVANRNYAVELDNEKAYVNVPWTDQNVIQTGIETNGEYPILFKNSNNTTNETAGIKYGNKTNYGVTINPSTGTISAKSFSGDISLANVTNADDLKAIEALNGVRGFLKKTAANTWALDTNTYATTADVNQLISAANALIFQGTIGTAANGGMYQNLPSSDYLIGYTYRVVTAATYAGQVCEVGDLLIALENATENQSTIIPSHWIAVQGNIEGVVSGPASSINDHIVLFSGTNGHVLKDSGTTIANAHVALADSATVATNVHIDATSTHARYYIPYVGTSGTGNFGLEDSSFLSYQYGEESSSLIIGGIRSAGRLTLVNGNGNSIDIAIPEYQASRTYTLPLSTQATDTIALVSSNITGTATNVTGTVSIAHGGTGATTAAAAWTALGGNTAGKQQTEYFVAAVDSTDEAVVRFNGVNGQVQDSLVTIDDYGNVYTDGKRIPNLETNNDSLGDTTTPVYIDNGEIKSCLSYSSANVNYASNADTVDNIHAEGFLRNFYYNTELDDTDSFSDAHYLFTVGGSTSWTGGTLPDTADAAFGVLHMHLKSGNYYYQLGFNAKNNELHYRSVYNSNTWSNWRTVLSSSNYTDYTVTQTGGHASGTWGINITGSSGSCTGLAAKATADANNDTIHTTYLKLSGGTMTGLITLKTEATHTGIKLSDTYVTAIGGQVIYQNNSGIRFGTNDWNWNAWAGLKYVHSTKTISLGLADGTTFNANNAQSGGTLDFPGIDKVVLTTNSGGIYKYYKTASTAPTIQINSNNLDVSIIKIDGDNPTGIRDSQAYGFNLKYIGTGSGAGNTLRLIADNSNGTDVTAMEWSGDGKVGVGSTYNSSYTMYVNGSSYFNGNATYNGNISFTNSGTGFRGISYGTMGDNDEWRIGGAATGANGGYMEIATADEGTEPIYVRQYTGVFSTIKRTLTLLDANGYMLLPSYINVPTTNSENPTVAQFIVTNGSDSYYRKASLVHVASAIDGEHKWVRLDGDTMTGALTLKGGQYGGNYGLNANNSDIIGINSLRFSDTADTYGEGICFVNGSNWDCIAAAGGNFYFKGATDGSPALSLANSTGNLYANTLNLNSNITFAATGTTGTAGGIYWSGSTDGAQLYYTVSSSDAGILVLNMIDDANARFSLRTQGTERFAVNSGGISAALSLTFSDANIGIRRVGRSVNWVNGRDSAIVASTSINGYGAVVSIKTSNGSWDIGAYNNSSYTDDLLFSYCTDVDYTPATYNNRTTAQIKFLENGHIVATLDGNASTATKFNSNRTIELTGAVTGSATANGESGWTIATTKNHTHPVSELTWAGGVNLTPTASANNQEWSIDLNPGTYTGTYWHVWSSKNSKTILACYTDDNSVSIPNGSLTVKGTVYINNTTDVGKDQNGALIIGTKNGVNIGIDNDEIMARNNSAAATLYIQSEGGAVQMGAPLTVSSTISATGGSISATAGNVWAGTNGNTDAERQVGVQSGAGQIYMYSAAATSGNRGIQVPAHGTGSAKDVFIVDTNNAITFYGNLSGNAATVSRATFGDSSNGEHDCDKITSNGLWYYSSHGPSGLGNYTDDAALYSQAYNSSWVGQIAQDYRTGSLFVRSRNNGTWQSWKAIPSGIPYAMTNKIVSYDATTQKFIKVGSNTSWDGQAYSTIGYKECRVVFKAGQTNTALVCGLNEDPSSSVNNTSIKYGWDLGSNGALTVREGSTTSSITGHTTYAAGDELIIEYSNGAIRYYHNGKLCKTTMRNYGTLLYFDSSFNTPSGYIYSVQFEVVSSNDSLAYTSFTINSGMKGVKLTSNAFTAQTYVAQIVVTSGEANLTSKISWTSADGYIQLTTSAATGGAVSGYILTGRGYEITATASDITS